MRALRSVLSCTLSASLVLGAPAPAQAAGPAARAEVARAEIRIGQADRFTRLELAGLAPKVSRQGADIVLAYPGAALPDVARLKITPPRFLKGADVERRAGLALVRLHLAEGADARMGRDDGVTWIALGPASPAAGAPAPQDQTPQPSADPAPPGGVVRLEPALEGRVLSLRFAWRAPLGAAVFRRGEAVWVVFDAPAKLDVSGAPRGLPQLGKAMAVQGGDYSAVRLTVPATQGVFARQDGAAWTVLIGPAAEAPPAPIKLNRDETAGLAQLTAQVAGATGVFWLADPAVGDQVAVVTARGPAKGMPAPRTLVEAELLASAQGLAVRPAVDDLQIHASTDVVRIGRPRGLALSAGSAEARRISAPVGLPQPAAMPGLIDTQGWARTGEGGFLPRLRELQDAAAGEAGQGRGAGVQARMALARFLVGSELGFEAIGVLNGLAKAQPALLGDPEFRGLRGAAKAMCRRWKDAQADFSAPAVAEDPASALWRGYVAERVGDWAGARQGFSAGRSALSQFAPKWRARFARADAEAALAQNDLGAARSDLLIAAAEKLDPEESLALDLLRARLFEAQGQAGPALALYDRVAQSPHGALAAPALLHATQIRMAQGRLPPAQALATLDSLRFRWRGDATELETIRALGRIYLAQGRYREALSALRSAGKRLPDLPAALGLQNDLTTAFRSLFLEGQADGLQPIQALALFYDFKELTPIGADGDEMVRRLVKRLVDVDLLDQAAELLKYQVDNRLEGVAKATVATDLAMIDVMNRQPEAALDAINSSRTTLLPAALNVRRRVLEARALMMLGRFDHAAELLGADRSPEVLDARAEIAWSGRAWAQAGQLLEAELASRPDGAGPLSGEDQIRLLRAATAYSLAHDDKALARLRARYGQLAETAAQAPALRVALSGQETTPVAAADFTRAASDSVVFAGWVQEMKRRFLAAASAPALPAAASLPAAKRG